MRQLLRAENTSEAISPPILNIPMETEKYISSSPNPGRSYCKESIRQQLQLTRIAILDLAHNFILYSHTYFRGIDKHAFDSQ